MSFLRRPRPEQEHAAAPAEVFAPMPAPPLHGTSPCSLPGCHSHEGVQCAYRDRRNAVCPTAWCPPHQSVMEGAVYCRRHAGVMRALLSVPEEERDPPELDNRAPSLCEWVALSIEAPVMHMLSTMAAQRPGAQVISDGLHLLMSGTPRVRGWEHKWRLFDHTGPLQSLGIRIDEPHDESVLVKVNGRVVFETVPPWVTNRDTPSPEEDSRRRIAFHQALLDAMAEGMRREPGFI